MNEIELVSEKVRSAAKEFAPRVIQSFKDLSVDCRVDIADFLSTCCVNPQKASEYLQEAKATLINVVVPGPDEGCISLFMSATFLSKDGDQCMAFLSEADDHAASLMASRNGHIATESDIEDFIFEAMMTHYHEGEEFRQRVLLMLYADLLRQIDLASSSTRH